jgi:hypothetical protein
MSVADRIADRAMDNGLAFMALIIAGVMLFLAPMMAVDFYLSAKRCHARWDASATPTRYGFWTGCLVLRDGRWVPERIIREIRR